MKHLALYCLGISGWIGLGSLTAVAQVAEKAVMVVIRHDVNADAVRHEFGTGISNATTVQSYWSAMDSALDADFQPYQQQIVAAVESVVPQFTETDWRARGKMVDIPVFSATAFKGSAEEMANLRQRLEATPAHQTQQVEVIEFTKQMYIDDAFALASSATLPSAATAVSASSPAWGVRRIRAPEVWQRGVRGKGVIVAVIDSGLDRNHPAFAGPGGVIWDVRNNLVRANTLPMDDRTTTDSQGRRVAGGHGTHVAGIIAGANGIGVAPDATLLPIKVFDNREGNAVDFFIAVDRAVQGGAQVINMSFGEPQLDPAGISTAQKQFLLSRWTEAVRGANTKGVVIVAASGNKPGPQSWGAYDVGDILIPGAVADVITVAASNSQNQPAAGSRPLSGIQLRKKGPDLAAPGGDWTVQGQFVEGIPSARSGGQDNVDFPGTSMAAPHVSGVCALLLSQNSSTSPAQLKQRLIKSTLPGTAHLRLGAGIVDAYATLFEGSDGNDVPPVRTAGRLDDVIRQLEDIRAELRQLPRPSQKTDAGESSSLALLRSIREEMLWDQRDALEVRIETGLADYQKMLDAANELDAELEERRTQYLMAEKQHAAHKKAHRQALQTLRDRAASGMDSTAEATAEQAALMALTTAANQLTELATQIAQLEAAQKDKSESLKLLDEKIRSMEDRLKLIQSRMTL